MITIHSAPPPVKQGVIHQAQRFSMILLFTRPGASPGPRALPLLAVLLGLWPSASAIADGGTLTFIITAEVVATTCNVVTEDANQTIEMGDMSTSLLEYGDSYHKPFTIRLKKCTGGSNNKVNATLTFASTTPTSEGWFYPAGDDGAKRGIMLGFTDKQKNHIALGKAVSQEMSTTATNNQFELGVMVRRNGTAPLVTGDFTAAATATITYQ